MSDREDKTRTCDRCGAEFSWRKNIQHSRECPKQGAGADLAVVALELVACGDAHEPMCRLIGNIRADELARLGRVLLTRDAEAEHVRAQYHALSQMLSPPGFGPASLAETCAEARRLYREEERLGKRVAKLEALRVIAAAIHAGGVTYSLPPPARHHNVLFSAGYQHHRTTMLGSDEPMDGEQGFLLSDGTFATRERAWEVAVAAGQLLERAPTDGRGGTLFSEDVW